jgi:hypothetical protein
VLCIQGVSEGVSSVKEGKKIHLEAQQQASQTQVAGTTIKEKTFFSISSFLLKNIINQLINIELS